MSEAILSRRGGTDVSEATATPDKVLEGTTFYAGEDDEIKAGTMPNKGIISKTLNAGESYTVQSGWHAGGGVVKANDLASQTPANALADNIISNKTAWVNGNKVTGTMPINTDVSKALNAGESYTVPHGWNSGGGKVTANSLASQTVADATAGNILEGKTVWVNGSKVTGSMPNRGQPATALNAGGSYTIPSGYHNGAGKVTANSLASQTSATATVNDIRSGKTVWVNGAKITGTIPDRGSSTITPTTSNQTIGAGYYLSGVQTIKGAPNLVPNNIRNGVSIFGITGNLGGLSRSTPTALSVARHNLAATTVGDYALFGGGRISAETWYATVDAYNRSLARSTPTALSVVRCSLAATTVGGYALFAGGADGYVKKTVDAYNGGLVRSTPTELSSYKYAFAATTVGEYALFAGGGYVTVDAYNSGLVRSTPTELSAVRYRLAATTVGDYALFGGGHIDGSGSSGGSRATVDAYNRSLVRSTPTELSAARCKLAATTVGDYALFGGGNYCTTVDAYNGGLVRSTPTGSSVVRENPAATTVGGYALFAGSTYATVDAYNRSLVRSTPTELLSDRRELAATTVGDYALFGGGRMDTISCSNIDAFCIIQ